MHAYELVITNEPTAKTMVTGFDALEFIPEDLEIVIGAGTVPVTSVNGRKAIENRTTAFRFRN